jgi:hypothetical protein
MSRKFNCVSECIEATIQKDRQRMNDIMVESEQPRSPLCPPFRKGGKTPKRTTQPVFSLPLCERGRAGDGDLELRMMNSKRPTTMNDIMVEKLELRMISIIANEE